MKTLQERTVLFSIFAAAYAAAYAELLLLSENADLTIEELQDSARTEALHVGAKQLEQLEYPDPVIQSAQEYFLYKHKFAQDMVESEKKYPTLQDLEQSGE